MVANQTRDIGHAHRRWSVSSCFHGRREPCGPIAFPTHRVQGARATRAARSAKAARCARAALAAETARSARAIERPAWQRGADERRRFAARRRTVQMVDDQQRVDRRNQAVIVHINERRRDKAARSARGQAPGRVGVDVVDDQQRVERRDDLVVVDVVRPRHVVPRAGGNLDSKVDHPAGLAFAQDYRSIRGQCASIGPGARRRSPQGVFASHKRRKQVGSSGIRDRRVRRSHQQSVQLDGCARVGLREHVFDLGKIEPHRHGLPLALVQQPRREALQKRPIGVVRFQSTVRGPVGANRVDSHERGRRVEIDSQDRRIRRKHGGGLGGNCRSRTENPWHSTDQTGCRDHAAIGIPTDRRKTNARSRIPKREPRGVVIRLNDLLSRQRRAARADQRDRPARPTGLGVRELRILVEIAKHESTDPLARRGNRPRQRARENRRRHRRLRIHNPDVHVGHADRNGKGQIQRRRIAAVDGRRLPRSAIETILGLPHRVDRDVALQAAGVAIGERVDRCRSAKAVGAARRVVGARAAQR